MHTDRIDNLLGAVIQHGPSSNRIYIMHTGTASPAQLVKEVDRLGEQKGYTKIFAKVPASASRVFLDNGYVTEAEIPGFFNGRETAHFLARYLDRKRSCIHDRDTINGIIASAKAAQVKSLPPLPEKFRLQLCRPDNATEMSNIYRTVFPTYPFPIDNPEYLCQTMKSHIAYFSAASNEETVALASSEMDIEHENVEMTDFATLPSWRGHNLAGQLLKLMEQEMRHRKIKTAYTIARAISAGMNITFGRAGYTFSGTLVNNTNISGCIESMNVWYKPL